MAKCSFLWECWKAPFSEYPNIKLLARISKIPFHSYPSLLIFFHLRKLRWDAHQTPGSWGACSWRSLRPHHPRGRWSQCHLRPGCPSRWPSRPRWKSSVLARRTSLCEDRIECRYTYLINVNNVVTRIGTYSKKRIVFQKCTSMSHLCISHIYIVYSSMYSSKLYGRCLQPLPSHMIISAFLKETTRPLESVSRPSWRRVHKRCGDGKIHNYTVVYLYIHTQTHVYIYICIYVYIDLQCGIYIYFYLYLFIHIQYKYIYINT